MKRARVEEVQFGARSGSAQSQHHRIITGTHNNTGPTVQYQINPGVLKTSSASDNSALIQPPNIQYTTSYNITPMAGGNVTKSGNPAQTGQHVVNSTTNAANAMRHKGNSGGGPPVTMSTTVVATGAPGTLPGGQTQFQRLKVEDALSYLDQVKFKFGNQPQVYNDFLDIMKEFKSQAIDTPGVIQRVSNLFKGHPELIVGFNTFLPPGYKIEVQANDQGYAFQVSVSIPPSCSTACPPQQSPPQKGTQIIHTIPQPAVNLITHSSGPLNLHGQPIQPATPIVGNLTSQSFTPRERERTVSGSNVPIVITGNTGIVNSAITTVVTGSINDITTSAQNLHQLSNQAMAPTEPGATPNQPVEFNHAISYVNKIKNRFLSQPEKYKKFLEILHTYQKEQKLKEGTCTPQKQLTEAEVYNQVAKLFDQQEDLLREFGQFLPDATSHAAFNKSLNAHNELKKIAGNPAVNQHNSSGLKSNNSQNNNLAREREYSISNESKEYKERNHIVGPKFGHNSSQVKRSPSYSMPIPHLTARDRDGPPPPKRHKPICRDVTFAEASKYGSLHDFAFFDKVRKALRSPEVYENFLRCLTLFTQEIVSKSELLNLVSPFLSKFPDLQKWFQEFLGPSTVPESVPLASAQRQDRTQSELAQEIDYSTCIRLGASYCALPKTRELHKCSGRTQLCKEVLNDTWVSFPTWSEDSTFVTSRKTQYEEIIYRCEDERFELDVVIETNSATIRVLEGLQKKFARMSSEDVAKFRLDDCLGGNSQTIHQRSIRRIYGDKSNDIIKGLKTNTFVAVPIVLRRLKSKEEEWRDAQKGFNKQWRDQNEKYYLKSLDHQGITFKQNDIKALRSKSLFNEIETLYDERHDQNEEGVTEPIAEPHLILPYKDKTILEDAANLLIHHVKRQTGIQKQEKTKIKHILRQFVPDLFFAPRQQLSDDEREDDDKDMDVDNSDGETQTKPSSSKLNPAASINSKKNSIDESSSSSSSKLNPSDNQSSCNVKSESERTLNLNTPSTSALKDKDDLCNLNKNSVCNSTATTTTVSVNNTSGSEIKTEIEIKEELDEAAGRSTINTVLPPHAVSKFGEEAYTLMFANNNWYLFLRLHAILCERLRGMYDRAQILAAEEAKYRNGRREDTATSLRLKPKSEIQVEDYYPTFLDMLKNVLDGNMDGNNYEDSLREMFGIHAYTAFTLDRVVSNAVRQLQHCVTEKGALECVELFHVEQRRSGAGGICKTANKRIAAELAYQRKAEQILQDENCFKVYIYKIDCRITIELLDTESEDTEKSVANSQAWSNYVERFSNPAAGPTTSCNNRSDGGSSLEIKTEKPDDELTAPTVPRKPLFLQRNIRKFKVQKSTTETIELDEEKTDADGKILLDTITSITTTTTTTNSTTITEEMTSNDPIWGKRMPERLGASVNDTILLDDKTEVKLNVNSYKMVFLANKDSLFYRKNSLKKAKQSHPLVTKSRQKKFLNHVSNWMNRNVSENQKNQTKDWLIGQHPDLIANITTILQDNDLNKTPYTVYNRYRVKKTES